MELEGSLDGSWYNANWRTEERMKNQNIFPFCLNVEETEVGPMHHDLLGGDWLPTVQQRDYRFLTWDIGTMLR